MKKKIERKFSKVYDWTFVEYVEDVEQFLKEVENEKL